MIMMKRIFLSRSRSPSYKKALLTTRLLTIPKRRGACSAPHSKKAAQMHAAHGYEDLMHASRAQLEASGRMDAWRRQHAAHVAAAAAAVTASTPPTARTPASRSPPRATRIELCSSCQGHRLEKVLYNGSMVLERTCSHCDGEGVITTTATTSDAPRDAQQHPVQSA